MRCYSLCLWVETVYKDLMLGTPKPLEGLQGLLSLPQSALNAWGILYAVYQPLDILYAVYQPRAYYYEAVYMVESEIRWRRTCTMHSQSSVRPFRFHHLPSHIQANFVINLP